VTKEIFINDIFNRMTSCDGCLTEWNSTNEDWVKKYMERYIYEDLTFYDTEEKKNDLADNLAHHFIITSKDDPSGYYETLEELYNEGASSDGENDILDKQGDKILVYSMYYLP